MSREVRDTPEMPVEPSAGSFGEIGRNYVPAPSRATVYAAEHGLLKDVRTGVRPEDDVRLHRAIEIVTTFLSEKGAEVNQLRGIAEHGQSYEDVFQLAVLGLYKAIGRYDPDDPSGAKLPSYARMWMAGTVLNAHRGGIGFESDKELYMGPLIRVPGHHTGFHQINAYISGQEADDLGEPTKESLEAETDFSDAKIDQYFKDLNRTRIVPLSGSVVAEVEAIPDTEEGAEYAEAEAKMLWQEVEPWLAPRELFILHSRVISEMKDSEISHKLARFEMEDKPLTRERIRQIYKRILEKAWENPALAQSFGFDVICDPQYNYKKMWRDTTLCPIKSLPSPKQVIERNVAIYLKLHPDAREVPAKWLPEELK